MRLIITSLPWNHKTESSNFKPLLYSQLHEGFMSWLTHYQPPTLKIVASSLVSYFGKQCLIESSYDKSWSTGEGDGKPLQYYCLENPMNNMKRQKDMTLKYELTRSVGAQYATGEEWRKNEETEQNWKQRPVVDVTGDGSRVLCCKEQYW